MPHFWLQEKPKATSSRKWDRATHLPRSPSRTRSEELRYALDYAHLKAKERRIAGVYQPGDVAVCRASLVRIFYEYLELQGYPLSTTDVGATTVGWKPERYCVVNRHLGGSQYEVYILTTFCHAQHVHNIPWMGQYFSIPMGATGALSVNVPPIVSYPPFLGEKSPSFLFAIPTRQNVMQTEVRYRVPHSELQRISKHARHLTMELPKHQRLLRNSVKDMYWGEAKWGGDGLALAPSANMERETDEIGSMEAICLKPSNVGSSGHTTRLRGRIVKLPHTNGFGQTATHFPQTALLRTVSSVIFLKNYATNSVTDSFGNDLQVVGLLFDNQRTARFTLPTSQRSQQ
ncbi:hypothetical protein D9619_005488 [Psilocybe cf. subviscida]|uniref:Uncharacterized protein n=1 Tax=Psilocybe cf. subviscida TaxID=2480587 RepID=A0A8H5FBC0_9AGAR|nr:hypothetical protein D9619_005488 [Psilocybe cf. subviscida]